MHFMEWANFLARHMQKGLLIRPEIGNMKSASVFFVLLYFSMSTTRCLKLKRSAKNATKSWAPIIQ